MKSHDAAIFCAAILSVGAVGEAEAQVFNNGGMLGTVPATQATPAVKSMDVLNNNGQTNSQVERVGTFAGCTQYSLNNGAVGSALPSQGSHGGTSTVEATVCDKGGSLVVSVGTLSALTISASGVSFAGNTILPLVSANPTNTLQGQIQLDTGTGCLAFAPFGGTSGNWREPCGTTGTLAANDLPSFSGTAGLSKDSRIPAGSVFTSVTTTLSTASNGGAGSFTATPSGNSLAIGLVLPNPNVCTPVLDATFTPTVNFATSTGQSITVASATATYSVNTRCLVTLQESVTFTISSLGTGALQIGGAPQAAAAAGQPILNVQATTAFAWPSASSGLSASINPGGGNVLINGSKTGIATFTWGNGNLTSLSGTGATAIGLNISGSYLTTGG